MATIFCFSSTGNSLYVAKRLAEKINASVISMTEMTAECNDDVIGIVFPVFFFGLPKTVESFLRQITFTAKDPYIFMVATYGDDVYGLEPRVAQLLNSKNILLSYAATLKTAENYLPMYSDSYNEHSETFEIAIKQIVNDVQQKKIMQIKDRISFFNRLVYAQYPALKKTSCDSYFTVSGCIGCGNCVTICPHGNITIKDSKPVFSGNCELCLGCLHICPTKAINWKQKTKDKKRYRNSHITCDELISFTGKKS